MATKKKTAKKTTTKKTARVTAPAPQRKSKREARGLENLGDVMEDVAAGDQEDAVTSSVNRDLKELQAYLETALLECRSARKSSATHKSQLRCIQTIGEMLDEAIVTLNDCEKVLA